MALSYEIINSHSVKQAIPGYGMREYGIFFGGHFFSGEDPADTLKRELDEELCIPTQFELVATADFRPRGYFELVSFYIYFVTAWWGVPVTRRDEHSEIKWFDRNELNEIQLVSEQYLSIIDAWQKASPSLG